MPQKQQSRLSLKRSIAPEKVVAPPPKKVVRKSKSKDKDALKLAALIGSPEKEPKKDVPVSALKKPSRRALPEPVPGTSKATPEPISGTSSASREKLQFDDFSKQEMMTFLQALLDDLKLKERPHAQALMHQLLVYDRMEADLDSDFDDYDSEGI